LEIKEEIVNFLIIFKFNFFASFLSAKWTTSWNENGDLFKTLKKVLYFFNYLNKEKRKKYRNFN